MTINQGWGNSQTIKRVKRVHPLPTREEVARRRKQARGRLQGKRYDAPMSALVVGEPVSALSVERDARHRLAFDIACSCCGMHACPDYQACKRGPCAPASDPEHFKREHMGEHRHATFVGCDFGMQLTRSLEARLQLIRRAGSER